jgi:uncharacterized membrane protein (DUF373 family)
MAPISPQQQQSRLKQMRRQGNLALDRLNRSISATALGDRPFLRQVHRFERQLAKVLAAALILVLIVATAELLFTLVSQLVGGGSHWFGEDMTRFLDQILALLIALEVLQNLTAYLRDHVVQIELVLITALTALARKVIVMPHEMLKTPGELAGLGIAVLALASAYWLVRHSHISRIPTRREPANGSPELDRSPQPGDAAQG